MTAITCPRCDAACEPVNVSPSVTHYRCSRDGCEPAHPLYQGLHPAKFWALFVAEVVVAIVTAVGVLVRRLFRRVVE